MGNINLAVVGGTGAVGRTLLEILEEGKLNLPVNQLRIFASKRSAGTRLQCRGVDHIVEEASEDKFAEVDLAIFSAGGSISKALAPKIAESGTLVIDNSSAFRMEEAVPLVAAGVNDEDAKAHQGIIANPNCSTIQMVGALKPVYDQVGINRIVVSTYQAVSGTGYDAMEELKDQTRAYLAGEDLTSEVYPHQIAFNMLPHLDDFDESGYTKEELKMINETKKIFHDHELGVTATTVRVPVFIGHSESVNLATEHKITAGEVRELLENAPGIILEDEPKNNAYPMPVNCAGKDEIFVGRIREDHSIENGINMWVVSDNLRKGAAFNAAQITEYVIENKLV